MNESRKRLQGGHFLHYPHSMALRFRVFIAAPS
jgi:hypothetical protein